MSGEKEFVIADVMPGKLNALVKNIICQTGASDANEAVRLVNSGEWVVSKPSRSWREEDGVIYFSVTSDGTTGEGWIKRLQDNGFCVECCANQMLCSPDFKPTSGVTTEVAVLKGSLFENEDRTTKKIRADADKRKLGKPNAELACLIREKFTDKEIQAMRLWHIVTMHEPIYGFDDFPLFLGANRFDSNRWLSVYNDGPVLRWDRATGFAFVVSQVSSQS